MLMGNLIAVIRMTEGQVVALTSYMKMWEKSIMYWNAVKPNDNVCQQILNMMQLRSCLEIDDFATCLIVRGSILILTFSIRV